MQPRDSRGRFLSTKNIGGVYIPPQDKLTTLVTYLIDESGSMAQHARQVTTGFAEYINGLKSDNSDDCLFSLTLFEGRNVRTPIAIAPLQVVTPNIHFRPGGMTPLYDAIGKTIRETDRVISQKNLKVNRILMVIHTDGLENASSEYNLYKIQELIKEKEASGFWSFTYLGADLASVKQAQSMGFNIDNVAQYDTRDFRGTFANVAMASNAYRGASAAASVSFFSGMKGANGQLVKAKKRYEHLSSDRYTKYTTTEWEDGTWSCNCPGWANRKTCKHIGGGVSAILPKS